jgi:hypothetical protein
MARRLGIAARMCSGSPVRAHRRNPGVALADSILGSKTRRHAGFAGGAFIIDRTPTGVQRMSGTVSNIATFNEDIATADSASWASFRISLSGGIVGKADLYAITPQNGALPAIIGGGGPGFDDCRWAERVNPDANRPIAEWRA